MYVKFMQHSEKYMSKLYCIYNININFFRIKTYRKTAPWSSHGNDIMQTLSRYYSNTFSDAEKQNTMNLFLGLFVPEPNRPPIWEYPNDYQLHHPEAVTYIPNQR